MTKGGFYAILKHRNQCLTVAPAVQEVAETAFTARLHAPGIFPRCLCAPRPRHSSICFDAVKEIQLNELWPSDSTSCLLLIYSTEASLVQKAGQIILIFWPCCSGNVSIFRFQASVFPNMSVFVFAALHLHLSIPAMSPVTAELMIDGV